MTSLPAELHSLPLSEKLQLLDLLWSGIKSAPGFLPPEWHGEILSERVERYREGKTTPLNLENLAGEWRKNPQS
jgi:hypothetical protein